MSILKKYCSILLTVLLLVTLLPIGVTAAPERVGIANQWEEIGTGSYPAGTYYAEKKLENIPVTMEAWVYLPKGSTGTKLGTVIGNYAKKKKDNFIFSIEKYGIPQLTFTSPQQEYVFAFGTAAIPEETWTHVVIVYDEELKQVLCYLNGELKSSSAQTQWYAAPQTILEDRFSIAGDVRPMNTNGFKGILSDVTVYRDVRSAQEIGTDAENGPDLKDPDLMLHYDLSSATPQSDIPDASGNGYLMRYSRTWVSLEEMEKILQEDENNYTYSIAFLPDIQYTTEFYQNNLPPVFDYLINHQESENIRYLITLGDLTNSNTPTEWGLINQQLRKLKDKLPYSLIRGNHDIYDSGAEPLYDETFAKPGTDYYEHVMANGGSQDPVSVANTYLLFTAGQVDYILLNLDFGAGDSVLEWANDILQTYADRRAIVATHGYLQSDGSLLTGDEPYSPSTYMINMNDGDDLWEKLIRKHANISMVVCGHISSDITVCSVATGDAGNKVYQIMMDVQSTDNLLGGVGMINLMRFTDDGRYARLDSYSTVLNSYFHEANTEIKLDFGPWTPKTQAGEALTHSARILVCVCAAVVVAIAVAVVVILKKKKNAV